MENISANILVQAAATSFFVKPLVDAIKLAWDAPRWTPLALALIFGILISNLLQMSAGVILTQKAEADAVLAGLLAAVGAVGVTELHNKAIG